MNLDKLKSTLAVRNYRQRERERSRLIPAILGDGAGHVMVGTDAGRLYVRLLGENDYVIQVSNATSIQLREGVVVDLERIWSTGASQYRVVGYSALVTYVNNPYANMPGAHGGTHERRDFGTGNGTLPPDPVDVYTPMLTSVRVQVQNPAGLTLRISAGWYKDARGFAHYYDGGNSPAFTIPGLLEQRVDLLYFDVAGTATILQGAVSMGSTPTCPACPRQATPLKYIWLNGSMTAIDSEIYFYDPRLIINSVETAGQLETWTYANAGARTTATGFTTDDIGCIAYQSDTQTYWRLLTTAPTWVQCGGPPSGTAPDTGDYWVETATGSLPNSVVVGSEGIASAGYASLPAPVIGGRLFFPTDSLYLIRDTGAAQKHWGPLWPLTPPVATGFAWANQVDATLDASKGYWLFYDPNNVGIDWHHYEKAIPTAPWKITILLLCSPSGNYNECGLCLRDSVTNKKIPFVWAYVNGLCLSIASFNVNTIITDYLVPTYVGGGGAIWLQIEDNNTDWVYRYSLDGIAFKTVLTHTRNTYMTADKVGFAIASRSGGDHYGAVLSYAQT